MTALDVIAPFTKHEEGDYTADPRDSGNWDSGVTGHGRLIGSNLGVGAPAACAWMHPHETTVSVAWMKGQGVTAIWEPLATVRYWRPLSCDDVPVPVAAMLFDYGWNRGPANAARTLQEVLSVGEDGNIGPMTLQALMTHAVPGLLTGLADAQEASYRQLGNFDIYGKGWLARTERRLLFARSLAGITPAVAVHAATPSGKPVVAPIVQPAPVPVSSDAQSEADALDDQYNQGA